VFALVFGDRGGRAGAMVIVKCAGTCRTDAAVQGCDFPALDVCPHSAIVAFEHWLPPKSLHADIALAPKQRAAEQEVQWVPHRRLLRIIAGRRRRPAAGLAADAHTASAWLDERESVHERDDGA